MKPSPLLAGLLLAAFALPAPAQSPSLAEQTVAVLDQLSGGPHADAPGRETKEGKERGVADDGRQHQRGVDG